MNQDTNTLSKLIRKNCDKYGNLPAIESEMNVISYHNLGEKVDYLSDFFSSRGVTKNQVVGIMLSRNIDLIPSMLAIWANGAAFYPLDPSYPLTRLQQYTEQANPSFIIADTENKAKAQSLCKNIIELDGQCKVEHKKIVGVDKSESKNLAYILFTSGSTGKPKGVKITHSALENFMFSVSKKFNFTSSDVMLAHSTICFDVSFLELFYPLYAGGKTIVSSDSQTKSISEMIKVLDKATFFHATPSYLQILLANGWKPNNLFTVLSGAEAINLPLVKKLSSAKDIWNLYGPTECTVYCSVHKININDNFIPIGKPLNGVSYHIFDADMNESDIGELYVSGDCLSIGYCESQADIGKFIFHEGLNRIIYKTGDFVKVINNEHIEWQGRSESEIKIRGNRIAPKEVQVVLDTINSVTQSCVTIANFNGTGHDALTAYLIADNYITKEEIEACLSNLLPDYMIPEYYVVLTEFPLMPNGKINKQELPNPNRDNILSNQSQNNLNIQDACFETTQIICDVLGDVTNISPFHEQDNYWELGLNSLSIFIAASKLTKLLNRKVTGKMIRNSNTAIELSTKI